MVRQWVSASGLMGLLAAIALLGGACSDDGDPNPTATPSEFDITAGYFRSLDDAVGAASDALNPQPVSDDDGDASLSTPSVDDAVSALQELESELAALDPPDAAVDAHARLLTATREIVAIAERNGDAAPDDATAEAEIAPAIAEFTDACLELVSASEEADSPIGISCGVEGEDVPVEEAPDEEPTAPPPPPTLSPPTPEA